MTAGAGAVFGSNQLHRRDVKRACKALKRVKGSVLRIVLKLADVTDMPLGALCQRGLRHPGSQASKRRSSYSKATEASLKSDQLVLEGAHLPVHREQGTELI